MLFGWLKRYMPRSLYGRAALILLLPVLTLQLVISVSFIERHFDGVTRQMSRGLVLELELLREVIAKAGGLDAEAEALAGALQLDVALPAPEKPQEDGREYYDLSGGNVIAALREEMPEITHIAFLSDDFVSVWVPVAGQEMQVTVQRKRVSATNPHQLIVLIVVLGALLSVIAYLFLRNQLRPIKRMAAAATAFGKGRMVPFTPTGATEVRVAGTAFLDMRARIERQTQQRTLMLSGVSHDLRTPLTRLKLGLSMLDDADTAPLMRDVDEMQALVDGFLDFARGDAEDGPTSVDVEALVREVVEDAVRAGQALRLHSVTGTQALEGPLSLRPLALRRALENLIGNALRYGTVAELSLAVGDRSVRFTVEDDGPGIPKQAREEAMRPFTRLDPARNQNLGSGVGLGLAIVADIARGHGGQLRLDSSERLGGLKAEVVFAR